MSAPGGVRTPNWQRDALLIFRPVSFGEEKKDRQEVSLSRNWSCLILRMLCVFSSNNLQVLLSYLLFVTANICRSIWHMLMPCKIPRPSVTTRGTHPFRFVSSSEWPSVSALDRNNMRKRNVFQIRIIPHEWNQESLTEKFGQHFPDREFRVDSYYRDGPRGSYRALVTFEVTLPNELSQLSIRGHGTVDLEIGGYSLSFEPCSGLTTLYEPLDSDSIVAE